MHLKCSIPSNLDVGGSSVDQLSVVLGNSSNLSFLLEESESGFGDLLGQWFMRCVAGEALEAGRSAE